jgi:hypothetical protein
MESRLDRGLRAIAWTAVLSTVFLLMAMGVFLFRPQKAEANLGQPSLEWEWSPEEETK